MLAHVTYPKKGKGRVIYPLVLEKIGFVLRRGGRGGNRICTIQPKCLMPTKGLLSNFGS